MRSDHLAKHVKTHEAKQRKPESEDAVTAGGQQRGAHNSDGEHSARSSPGSSTSELSPAEVHHLEGESTRVDVNNNVGYSYEDESECEDSEDEDIDVDI